MRGRSSSSSFGAFRPTWTKTCDARHSSFCVGVERQPTSSGAALKSLEQTRGSLAPQRQEHTHDRRRFALIDAVNRLVGVAAFDTGSVGRRDGAIVRVRNQVLDDVGRHPGVVDVNGLRIIAAPRP